MKKIGFRVVIYFVVEIIYTNSLKQLISFNCFIDSNSNLSTFIIIIAFFNEFI